MDNSKWLDVVRLPGLTDYGLAWALQLEVHAQVSQGQCPDTVLLLEHPDTLTMGRRGGWANLKSTPAALDALGFQRWQIDRGGDITYHGPGQLVGYPIVNLRRGGLGVGDFMRRLEQSHIDMLALFDIVADRLEGFPGVWCGLNKVTALGVRVTRWTTMHGFGLNVITDLARFDHIQPCGLEGKGVTSIAQQRGATVDMAAVEAAIAETLSRVFERTLRWRQPTELPWPSAARVAALRREHLLTGQTTSLRP